LPKTNDEKHTNLNPGCETVYNYKEIEK